MEDIQSVKARHGHSADKSFWWIEEVLIDGKRSSLQVMFGRDRIGDKTCVRVGEGRETWFEPAATTREGLIAQGKVLLRERLKGKKITTLAGAPYPWD